tara:strand:+ start:2019 stop:3092 length:1074 start_codon:yes stop_codon:yes gene_type:complete
MSKWTNDEIATLIISRAKGLTWAKVAKEINSKHGTKRHGSGCSAKYKELMNVDIAKEFTKEQTDFIQAMFLNNFKTSQIIQGFKEQFKRIIKEDDIDFVVKQILREEKVEEQIKTKKNKIKKEMKNMKRNHTKWTEKEDKQLRGCANASEALSLGLNRTKRAVEQRFYSLKKKAKNQPVVEKKQKKAKRGRMTIAELQMIRDCETVEEALALNLRKPETIIRRFATFNSKKKELVLAVEPKQKKKKSHGNKGKKYTPRWTKEQDYDLVLNFYELSIDEARNRFNRPYGAIATRLEMLVDSTKPEHISMLMKASKEIKSRKQSKNPTPQKSRRTLRKERKMAKKQAKLEAQLKKLRGV